MNRNGSKKRRQTVRVWELEQARKAVPYISAILQSLRQHHLEALGCDREARRLAAKPGRPDRSALVAHSEVTRQAQEAGQRVDQDLEELAALDVYSLDPLRGEAVIPFLHGKKLAWFVFDLFDEEDHLRTWRYHDDPLDTRRPLAEALAAPQAAIAYAS